MRPATCFFAIKGSGADGRSRRSRRSRRSQPAELAEDTKNHNSGAGFFDKEPQPVQKSPRYTPPQG